MHLPPFPVPCRNACITVSYTQRKYLPPGQMALHMRQQNVRAAPRKCCCNCCAWEPLRTAWLHATQSKRTSACTLGACQDPPQPSRAWHQLGALRLQRLVLRHAGSHGKQDDASAIAGGSTGAAQLPSFSLALCQPLVMTCPDLPAFCGTPYIPGGAWGGAPSTPSEKSPAGGRRTQRSALQLTPDCGSQRATLAALRAAHVACILGFKHGQPSPGCKARAHPPPGQTAFRTLTLGTWSCTSTCPCSRTPPFCKQGLGVQAVLTAAGAQHAVATQGRSASLANGVQQTGNTLAGGSNGMRQI